MGGQVEVRSVGDAIHSPQSPPAKPQRDACPQSLRVVRQLLLRMLESPEVVPAMPRSVYHGCARRSSTVHSSSVPGATKNSISICSNSRVRKMKFARVISLRNDLPTWPMPNGGFLRVTCTTLAKLTKMPWAVSGRSSAGRLVPRPGQVGLQHHVEVPRLGPLAAGAAVGQGISLSPPAYVPCGPRTPPPGGRRGTACGRMALGQRIGEHSRRGRRRPTPDGAGGTRVEADEVLRGR